MNRYLESLGFIICNHKIFKTSDLTQSHINHYIYESYESLVDGRIETFRELLDRCGKSYTDYIYHNITNDLVNMNDVSLRRHSFLLNEGFVVSNEDSKSIEYIRDNKHFIFKKSNITYTFGTTYNLNFNVVLNYFGYTVSDYKRYVDDYDRLKKRKETIDKILNHG